MEQRRSEAGPPNTPQTLIIERRSTSTHLSALSFQSTSDACVQTHRGSSRRGSNLERRRARSADLEKATQPSQLRAVEDRWVTEYMRCFSARLR